MNEENKMPELIRAVIHIYQWGVDRNIVGGASAQKQYLKLMSEFGELGDSIAKNNIEGIKDGIGDAFVVLVLIAAILGLREEFIFKLEASIPRNVSATDAEDELSTEDLYILASDKMTYLGITIVGNKANEPSRFSIDGLLRASQFLALIGAKYGLTMETCAWYAYNEIKDRKGVLFNGTFIKSTDARYDDALAQIAAQRAEQATIA